jgi:hypothetical protein
MRCGEPCGKVVYTSESMAKLACVKVALGGDAVLSWYYSTGCKCWHVTNTRRRAKTGKRMKWIEGFEGEKRAGTAGFGYEAA